MAVVSRPCAKSMDSRRHFAAANVKRGAVWYNTLAAAEPDNPVRRGRPLQPSLAGITRTRAVPVTAPAVLRDGAAPGAKPAAGSARIRSRSTLGRAEFASPDLLARSIHTDSQTCPESEPDPYRRADKEAGQASIPHSQADEPGRTRDVAPAAAKAGQRRLAARTPGTSRAWWGLRYSTASAMPAMTGRRSTAGEPLIRIPGSGSKPARPVSNSM